MKLRTAAIAAAIAVLATGAYAADPVAVVTTPGYTFGEYTGSSPVGAGAVNASQLFFIDEQSGPLGKSWYIFAEPVVSKMVDATITFDAPISSVITSDSGLAGTDATYGAAGITYATTTFTGLELGDSVSYIPGSNQLTIHFAASDPGDHIRVFTSAVPEPATYAMFAVGLIGLGVAKLRRRRA